MPKKKTYGSYEELGRDIIARYPHLEGRDPRDIAQQAEPQLAGRGIRVVEGWTDVNPWEAFRSFTGWGEDAESDFLRSTPEALRGIGSAAWSPYETTKDVIGLAKGGIAEAGASLAGQDDYFYPRDLQSQFVGPHWGPESSRATLPSPEDAFRDQGTTPWSLLKQLAGANAPEAAALLAGRSVQQMGRRLTGAGTDEERQSARDYAAQTREALQPHNVEQRPANALMTALGLIPVGPGQLAKAGTMGKVLSYANPAMAAERLVGAPFQAARGVYGLGKKSVGKEGVIRRLAEGAKQKAEDLRVGGRALKQEAIATGLAITTGRPRQFITQLIERARSPEFRKFFRDARKMDEGALANRIQTTALSAMNRLQKIMSDGYKAGTERWFAGGKAVGRMVTTAPIFEQLLAQLDKIGVEYIAPKTRQKLGRLNFRSSDVTDLGPARAVIRSQIKPILNMLQRADEVPLRELHRRRKLLDDAISTLTPTNPIAATARKGLVGVRESLADYLEANLPGQYAKDMAKYRRHSILRDELRSNLALEPGQIDKAGNVVGGTQEAALRAVEGSIGDSGIGSRRMRALEELEQVTGTKGIIDLQLAQMAQAWAGGGLIVRNELAQLARGMVAVVSVGGAATVGGIIAAIPAAALFSPRLMSDAILMTSGRGRQAWAFTGRQAERAQNSYRKISEQMNRLDKMTGGELRNTVIREDWNIGTMMERFEVQSEDGE